ncbi:2-dehydro-3-deoxy-D-gluconate 5-dehydrogenase [Vibrio nigripulchritudo SFn27]|uniref:2-dehydro-3-deoxy-D-gluconate 5-dehydrogenase n=1 Tax=Vibrio nigripulchritudo TaxID=28173 RepID=U4KGB6_9VIBR|nr:2-dehydro-3-deoxy-D-gluconate 5-dehydrogenase KduD [Vibrio nigripulchritudo]CCN82483.1 2-dehydro-3-deoxy-D-gluconate 5-dehydrogenase [Vibrio nigripulchritudo BLFn1]CCN91470.1 2-dehydro-3-deoxy-D-gluconate 5-dehydrogenase [Vibrio nigripulchritudo SFn27]CCN97634.1 2-dehydro-3-deoxy-D-gluconate 5-dehydrogenase [Vibrio nigripulchritudo ENn2]CCO38777.1 2-dehydro-3-deoxy-D-gluconate 5-dehydrogenase [Vibrio nigripulchritudo SFn135]CCO55182.1 2-dehydro-3-deoxy-D-gluconate 5-dehydrogenase [Vibrio ni
MKLFNLEGKVALVTGASKGLGQAMSIALAKAGADIVGVARSSTEQTQAGVERQGRKFIGIETDLGRRDAIDSIIQTLAVLDSTPDILVNNAGIIRREDSINFSEDDWDSVMDINLKSLFFLSQAAVKQWVAQNRTGKIINIASMLSFQGGIRVPSYTASKTGVLGLTRIGACEWAKYGINVNAIAPGYMATDNTKALREDSNRNSEILNRIPAGRWGEPEDMQGAAIFLASSASDYVNGAVLTVDGGWQAR